MRNTPLALTKEGYVRNIGRTATGSQPKFRLGFDIAEAARRRQAIEVLWLECEAARGKLVFPSKPVWDEARLATAQAIAKGSEVVPLQPIRSGERPEAYALRIASTRRKLPGITLQTDEQFADFGVQELSQRAADAAVGVATALAIPKATGQSFHAALDDYRKHVRTEFGSADGVTDNGVHVLKNIDSLEKYLPDCDLGALDYSGCDERFGILRRRPTAKRTSKPMSAATVKNLIGELGRFFRWLHKSKNHNFRKPEDYDEISKKIRRTDDDDDKEAEDVPTWTVAELATLNEYATPLERFLLYVGLNCSYGTDQLGRLKDKHLRTLENGERYIRRTRSKSGVASIHLLLPEVAAGIEWAQKRKAEFAPDSPLTLVTESGGSYWRQTAGGNRSQLIPNVWKELIARVQKDKPKFRYLPFNSLRDTSSNMIREIAGAETASVHLAHKYVSTDKHLNAYTNPVRRRHWKAIRKLGEKLQPVFAATAAPWDDRRKSYVGLDMIKRIREMKAEGRRPTHIAKELGISKPTVYRWLEKTN